MSQLHELRTEAADLSEAEFRRLVDSDTRGKVSAALSAQLRSPECATRWYQTLLSMQKSVEGQLAAKSAEARSAQAEFRAHLKSATAAEARRIQVEMLKRESRDEAWRAGALRFKTGLEERLGEARQVLREQADPHIADRTADERNQALARIATLEGAIRKHRGSFPDDDDPTPADLELWRLVSRVQ